MLVARTCGRGNLGATIFEESIRSDDLSADSSSLIDPDKTSSDGEHWTIAATAVADTAAPAAYLY